MWLIAYYIIGNLALSKPTGSSAWLSRIQTFTLVRQSKNAHVKRKWM